MTSRTILIEQIQVLEEKVAAAERERDGWRELYRQVDPGELESEVAELDRLREACEKAEAERDRLAEALSDAAVDPTDYILSRPSWEERREAAKCLWAAAALADGYGKPKTAQRFREASAMRKTSNLTRVGDFKRRNWQPVEPREGMVTVYDSDGRYVGCMGEETWRRVLSPDAEMPPK
jgi:hypothetical protein